MVSSFRELDVPLSPAYHKHCTPRQELHHRLATNETAHTSHALLVPTWSGHKEEFCTLLLSLVRNSYAVPPILFVSVFSTPEDRVSLLGACETDPRAMTAALRMHSLIFQPPLRLLKQLRTRPHRKFNFQSAKKLWALSQMSTDVVLVLDADFVLTRPVDLCVQMTRYAAVLFYNYRHPVVDSQDALVLREANMLLGTAATAFYMEPPWLFRPRIVRQVSRSVGQSADEHLRHEAAQALSPAHFASDDAPSSPPAASAAQQPPAGRRQRFHRPHPAASCTSLRGRPLQYIPRGSLPEDDSLPEEHRRAPERGMALSARQ